MTCQWRRGLCGIVAVLGCLAICAAPGCGGASSSPASPSTSTYTLSASELADMSSEKVMGNAAATVSIINYSSFTCPHCSAFHISTLQQIKAAYIDTGKVKYVYRDFPTTADAHPAAALARCAGSSHYFEALDLLYRSQATWMGVSNARAAMKQAVSPIGMTPDKMDACMASSEVESQIAKTMTEGWNTYGVNATPTFIINGQKIVGAVPFDQFDAVLKTLVK